MLGSWRFALWVIFSILLSPEVGAQSHRVSLKESGLSLALPAGWSKSAKESDQEETVGAFQSQDNTASLFVSIARASDQADMTQIMNGVINNFETAFIVKMVGELKTGTLAESPSVFTTLEADLRSANSIDTISFRFYLVVLDTGQGLYLVQASCQVPVKPDREAEVMRMIRSLSKISSGGQ